MRILTFLARRFVAGDTIDEAKGAVKKLNDQGLLVTLDILGENVKTEADAARSKGAYLNLLRVIEKEKLASNVSLKLTMLGLDQSAELCRDNLREIVREAKGFNNFVRVDMEGSPYTQKTIDIFKEVYKECRGHVGIVVQAYLFRSKEDIEILNGFHAPVRICKGAYKESTAIAFKNKKDVNRNFMALSRMLLENGKYPAFATHDSNLIAELKNYTREKKIEKDEFEFQMLYGIRRKFSKKLADEGYKVRIYVPYGTRWFPYTMRRLRERKENVFFVLKNLFTD